MITTGFWVWVPPVELTLTQTVDQIVAHVAETKQRSGFFYAGFSMYVDPGDTVAEVLHRYDHLYCPNNL